MIEERLYQVGAVNASYDYLKFSKDKGGGVIVSPTGSGKSFIIAMIAERLADELDDDNILLVVQPTKELLLQNVEKINELGIQVSVFSASLKRKEIGRITYATVASLKNVDLFKGKVKYVIQDECHLGSGKGTEFKKFVKNLRIPRFIGLTASPVYLESVFGITKIRIMIDDPHAMYKKILHCTQISEMIKLGYWAKIRYQIETVDTSLLKPNTTGTDFTEASLNDFYEENDIYDLTSQIIEENPSRKSILVFVSSTKLADKMALELKHLGAVSVHGKTDSKLRDKYIKSFKELKTRIVITVLALAVGFDHKQLDMLVDCAPTGSFQLYYQKWGRAVRCHPEKEDSLIVDVAGNFDKFGKLEDIRFLEVQGYGWVACSKKRVLTDVALAHGETVYLNDLVNAKKPESASNYIKTLSPELIKISKDGPSMIWGKNKGKRVHELVTTHKGLRFLNWAYHKEGYFEFGNDQAVKIHMEFKRITGLALEELGLINKYK